MKSNFVVFRLQGHQYFVSDGDEIVVDKLKDLKNIYAEVLLKAENGTVKLGKPVLKDVNIKFKVLEEKTKGEKVRIFKYKAKSRYRKAQGFRPQHSKLKISF